MHIKFNKLFQLIVISLMQLFFNTVNAALISVDDSIFGANSLTVDTSTNLAWLDLSITKGISFNEISNQLGSGGTYSGYRFASPDEIYSLFVEAGIPNINAAGDIASYGTVANSTPALVLVGLMGPTYTIQSGTVFLSEIAGLSSLRVNINGYNLIQMPYIAVREGVQTRDGLQSYGAVFTTGSSIFPSNSYEGVGSWLVKPAVVPLPPAVTLLFSGLAFLTIIARKNKLK